MQGSARVLRRFGTVCVWLMIYVQRQRVCRSFAHAHARSRAITIGTFGGRIVGRGKRSSMQLSTFGIVARWSGVGSRKI